LTEGLSSSVYTPPRVVPDGVIHENMGYRLEEGAGDLPAKVGAERLQWWVGRPKANPPSAPFPLPFGWVTARWLLKTVWGVWR
jgi:hypothetical protein